MQTSCEAWALQHRWVLSRGIDRAGPCPVCGGTDRFAIHTKKNTFLCRRCGLGGGGVIDLVMQTRDVGFVAACEIVTGRKADAPMDAAMQERLRRQAEADERRRRAANEAYRERAREDARKIWLERCRYDDEASAPVRAYLAGRAIDLAPHARDLVTLGFVASLPWTEQFTDERGNEAWRTWHVGPAMLAAIQRPDGRFGGVHITWLDAAQPRGRLVLPPDDRGKPRPTKKVRGTKKGGAIRLFTPAAARRIVMGEGIETTGTALCHAFEPETAYWTGIDIGNMGGRAFYSDGRPVHDQPDMDDLECFLPPDWCDELVYLGEADEPSVRSREKCLRGLRRARRLRAQRIAAGEALPPLSIIYVPPPGEAGAGDLNDLAMADMAETEGGQD